MLHDIKIFIRERQVLSLTMDNFSVYLPSAHMFLRLAQHSHGNIHAIIIRLLIQKAEVVTRSHRYFQHFIPIPDREFFQKRFPELSFTSMPEPEVYPLGQVRSEEHTSELQSRGHLVCRLLLEKKTTI